MNAIITKAKNEDLPTLNIISRAAKAHWGYPKEWLTRWDADLTIRPSHLTLHHVYKLCHNQTILGFCIVDITEAHYEVMHLWLSPEHIGQGYGKKLLQETLEKVVDQPRDIIVTSDPNAEAFYSKQGFVTFDKVESYPPGRYLPIMKKSIHSYASH